MPPLDCFDLGNVFLRVWVPDRHSILQQRADEDFISFFLNVGGINLYVASKEARDPVCFGEGVVDVVIPTHCVVY